MAIMPDSTVWLLNVPFDNSYKNQIYFLTLGEQQEYFNNKIVKTFPDCSYVRKEVDGKVHAGIRVDAHVDSLAICNYIMYTNSNYSSKRFYAFITEMVYKNDNCTEIYFETDCYQTWRFNIEVLPSFVVREHPYSDNIGEHRIPEDFSFKDYKLIDISTRMTDESLTTWGYLVGTTEQLGADGSRGKQMSGIYQGLYFYYYENENNLNVFLDEVEEEGGDCVQFICAIPKFCLNGNTVGGGDKTEGWVYYSSEPAELTLTTEKPPYVTNIDGYTPKNNKCFTSQFYNLFVSNNAGESNEYAFEDWTGENISFALYGDVSANPTVMLVPKSHKAMTENFEEGMTLAGFPQCAFNSDSFKLWLSRNQFSLGTKAVTDTVGLATGIATGNVTGVMNSAVSIAGTIGDIYAHSKDPNKAHMGSSKCNLLTACKQNKFSFYIKMLRNDYIKIVDDYFTMFGYKCNRVKRPQMSLRPCWNYVQTINVNISGAIPNNDMKVIKAMFDNGVTLWRSGAKFGDYSANNKFT